MNFANFLNVSKLQENSELIANHIANSHQTTQIQERNDSSIYNTHHHS